MKRVAFVFTRPPHGTSAGREGLDAVLAAAAFGCHLSVFFVGDGVFQLIGGQKPEKIRARNYIATFGVFSLYDIELCYVCSASLKERGLNVEALTVLQAEYLDEAELHACLSANDHLFVF